jgi:two-component system, chemotaxis family, chemotaxis protein CheY
MTTRHALVVDDSRATRALLKRLLVKHDFTVEEAGDGMEGMAQLAAKGPFDLALVDWNMPTMDGLAFIKAVRAEPDYERLALVMVTSENDPRHITRALMAGADEYAMKPLTAEALADKLELVGLGAES